MVLLGFISFAAPLMLAGLALLSLPIIAHLLNRRANRQIVFPSVQLLEQAVASQSQLFRLRKLILLLLRCLAVALIVSAFAWPMWVEHSTAAATGDDSVGVVVVADVSASTAQQRAGVRAMNSLQIAGGRAVDELLSGADVANVIHASAQPEQVFAGMTGNLRAVRQELDALEPTGERADFLAALSMAGDLLREHQGPRHVLVLTDLQQTNWEGVAERVAQDGALPEDARVTVAPVQAQAPGNVGLADPAIAPANPVVGEPVRARVQVGNYSDRQRTVTVDVELEGQSDGARSVSIPPWEQREVDFELTFEQPGDRKVRFTLPEDALAIDNAAYLVAHVSEQARIVLVGDDPVDEVGSKSYFLARALAPRAQGANPYQVQTISSREISQSALAGSAAVFVSHLAEELGERQARTLSEYIQQGGGVVFFAGDGRSDEALSALEAVIDGPAMPWSLGTLERGGWRLDDGQWDGAILEQFDAASRDTLRRVRLEQAWSVDALNDEAIIHLRFDDGRLALGTQRIKAGQVMIANFSPALDAGDLGQYGGFVALVHGIARVLEPEHASAEHHVGQQVSIWGASDGSSYLQSPEVRGPSGEPVADVSFSVLDDAIRAVVARSREPGFYELRQGEQRLGVEAVNMDPRESDLRQMDRDELVRQLRAAGAAVELAGRDDQAMLNVRGIALWGWMLAAALAVLGVEMALAGWWRR